MARRRWILPICLSVLAAVSLGVVISARNTEAASSRPPAPAPLPLAPAASLGHLASPGYAGAIGPERVPIPAGPTLAPPATTGRPIDGTATGTVTAFYNGQHWTGNPRNIPLNAHAQIQLDVSSPLVAPESISFPNGL